MKPFTALALTTGTEPKPAGLCRRPNALISSCFPDPTGEGGIGKGSKQPVSPQKTRTDPVC